ncbi:rRNA-binding ribosome biosynthesis protein [Tilletia horrida]|uniref:rRNA-binding ribosome biosynthesis protein n=1 Tax=Tilletia horrida TaxID=155126 RepID=A0AAN6JUU4_9BASI|nr:rRNA-binding ribosome biosynthesis protein [Tilletia horrida]KAK0543928.1 rRNA-binding ribosome biosynthesis protein [Tilletia horrida]KAK0569474.1 rRNA-binding ribosome biosynthesis protein [Tilletia horrida]
MAKQKRKKTRTHVNTGTNTRQDKNAGLTPGAPKSFVISSATHRLPLSLRTLVAETRRVMEPNTASRLRERRKNKLRDFLAMCGPLGVSHLLVFGQTKVGSYGGGGNINLRIMRAPRGPTLTFRINKYALAADLARARKRPHSVGAEYQTPPLLVLNNFTSDSKHVKVLVTVFQNLFPAIQVHNMRLTTARRIVLLNYNASTDTIDWRHYLITLRPVGISKSVRRAIEGTASSRSLLAGSITTASSHGGPDAAPRRSNRKQLVDLSSADDIAEFVLGHHRSSSRGQSPAASSAAAYDSETDADTDMSDAEDGGNRVELSTPYLGRHNRIIQPLPSSVSANGASSTPADDDDGDVDDQPDDISDDVKDTTRADQVRAPVHSEQRAVRLREIGPRMELRCIKIEEGLGSSSDPNNGLKKAVAQDLKTGTASG